MMERALIYIAIAEGNKAYIAKTLEVVLARPTYGHL